MIDTIEPVGPPTWREISRLTEAAGFGMPSEPRTGALLRALAATKPSGRLLEIGTGTGLATAWLLDGMNATAHLASVDTDPSCQAIARSVLGSDPRVEFLVMDGLTFLGRQAKGSVDLVFADAWPGKYEGLDLALDLLKPGGLYIVDDMAPQTNWPEGHQSNVDRLVEQLHADTRFSTVTLNWASGILFATRRT